LDMPPADAIFGGLVLLFVLGLILAGKIRLDREVTFRDELLSIKDSIIEEQNNTISELISNAKVTHTLLREIRSAAYNDNPPNEPGGVSHE